MKKFLIFLLVLIVLALVAGGIFLATFDLNKFLPVIREQLQKSLKATIQYQEASLGWKNGLAIEIQKLTIQPEGEHTEEDILKIDEIRAHLDLISILRGDIRIGSIDLVKPDVKIVKTRQGKTLILGLGNLSSQNADKASQTNLPFSFLIEDLKAASGEVLYRDESVSPVQIIPIHDLKLKIENFSLTRPFRAEISGNLLGETKNFDLSTKVQLSLTNQRFSFSETKLQVDLDNALFQNLKTMFPSLAESPVQNVSGSFEADMPQITVGKEGAENLDGRIRIRDGSLTLTSLPQPIQDIQAALELYPNVLQVNQVDFRLSQGAGQVRGAVQNWQKDPTISLEVNLNQIALADLATYGPSEPHFEGLLALSFKGNIVPQPQNPGLPPIIDGEGKVGIDRAVWVNMNLLHQAFSKLSMIPGLMNRLEQTLPEESKQKLQEVDTRFGPIQLPFRITQNVLRGTDLRLDTDSLQIQGDIQYQFKGPLAAQTMLKIAPDFSQAMMLSIAELKALADQNGLITFPLQISGVPPKVNVFPDLNYIGSKVIVNKGTEMLTDLFSKKKTAEIGIPTQTNPTGTASSQAPLPTTENQNLLSPTPLSKLKGKQLFGELLNAALSGSGNDNSSQQ